MPASAENKVFVGNLSWGTDNRSLGLHFASAGRVLGAEVVTDRETGKSRGFGFVKFADRGSVEAALKLDDSKLDGRSIRVRPANERH